MHVLAFNPGMSHPRPWLAMCVTSTFLVGIQVCHIHVLGCNPCVSHPHSWLAMYVPSTFMVAIQVCHIQVLGCCVQFTCVQFTCVQFTCVHFTCVHFTCVQFTCVLLVFVRGARLWGRVGRTREASCVRPRCSLVRPRRANSGSNMTFVLP